ncbi:cbb3-type cytochrome oxidase assembly protein CcoS [Spongiibacter nanhainus]|uniref:Cbb3-type cytochrome oxidase assembly protein CcoS n=1 Tax=Spongiibacter nanhainus TaxID=2794344 RepID=A0A7T4R2W9_9GAMM|nr:cbb3-type cytochrome oxidase assembly protein CcoS [Spongiibacter nanhainus]QQD19320.1 cbb3-type cytochrome oxidase assembly protein CcoS [Spongiibacter nanhainus]
MDSLAILLPIALLFFGIAAGLFWWAVSDKQYQDLDREGQRILFDTKRKLNTQTRSENAEPLVSSPHQEQPPRREQTPQQEHQRHDA